ncbi:hypothetical protein NQ315_005008 [Exocentrus adspersus]|uniref:Uncharacterized protein n=1 Tax=Exocentrus adspersus TaxID=1586481 RepID=A0AAV8VQ19_9CUCU|nr:hypothetical protein NQ315_005008 [Exocentrus adspersus]
MSPKLQNIQSLTHRRNNCRLVRRLVRKSGRSSILRNTNNSQHTTKYLRDLSNTLIESSWKWTLLIVCGAFILTWLGFAGLWMLISLESLEVDGQQCLEDTIDPNTFFIDFKLQNPFLAVLGITGFAGYLLFSVETQSTIGYGNRYINGYCPEAVILMCVQIIVGVCICGSLICIVYIKMVGPQKQHSMACFSKTAVICQRNSQLCLLFRVRDTAKRYECLTTMSAYLVQKKRGELFLKSIKLEPVGILIWPLEIVHKINESSPFWDMSAKDLIIKRFEIVVVMDGVSLATSHMSRTTTSYLSREIKWGHKFRPCTVYDNEKNKYVVDHSLFNKTEEIDTPLCSSQKLKQMYDEIISLSEQKLYFSPSTSKYSSPIFSSMKSSIQPSPWPEDDEDDTRSSIVTTSAIVHVTRDKKKIKTLKTEKGTDSSSSEDELTFQDICEEELPKENIEPHNNLETKSKDLLDSLQNFVLDNNNRWLHLASEKREFKETSL